MVLVLQLFALVCLGNARGACARLYTPKLPGDWLRPITVADNGSTVDVGSSFGSGAYYFLQRVPREDDPQPESPWDWAASLCLTVAQKDTVGGLGLAWRTCQEESPAPPKGDHGTRGMQQFSLEARGRFR